uniref:Uncharacterized protein n=1 Tax=Craspedostauros australis TaxID=1486917 RepID=A0A7S0F5W1_9STRA
MQSTTKNNVVHQRTDRPTDRTRQNHTSTERKGRLEMEGTCGRGAEGNSRTHLCLLGDVGHMAHVEDGGLETWTTRFGRRTRQSTNIIAESSSSLCDLFCPHAIS